MGSEMTIGSANVIDAPILRANVVKRSRVLRRSMGA